MRTGGKKKGFAVVSEMLLCTAKPQMSKLQSPANTSEHFSALGSRGAFF